MSNYTTGEIAKLCGVSVRTVQYYDTRKILMPTALTEGGRRLYSEDDLSMMKVICFLRELDVSIDNIARLLQEENSKEVISMILYEQRTRIEGEISEGKARIEKINELAKYIDKAEKFSVESIKDVAHVMENKRKTRKLHTTLLLTAIPISLIELGALALWIFSGIWWPFAVYAALAIPYAIWMTRYYFSHVAYICPHCHEIFVPSFREAFWANHTPTTRKLTCPACHTRGFCVETYRNKSK